MTFQVLYQLANLILIIEVAFMVKMLYDHLEVPENRSLFIAIIGLAIDLVGNFTITHAKLAEVAQIENSFSIFGRILFGFGIITYMGKKFHARFRELILFVWIFSILAVFVHSFKIPNDTGFLADVKIVNVSGMSLFVGTRGPVYFFNIFSVVSVGIWMFFALLVEVKSMRREWDNREFVNAFFYLTAIVLQGIGILVSEIFYGKIPNMVPASKSLAVGIYLALSLKYHFINYDILARQTLMDDVGAGFAVLSDQRRILYANDIAKALFPKMASIVTEEITDFELVSAIEKKEFQFSKNGRHYRVTADPIYDDGKVSGYTILIVDISDIVLLEKQAEQNAEARSNLLTNISHEIRTPLNTIIGASEMLEDDSIPETAYKDYVDVIKAGSMNLNDILNDLLAATTEAGKVQVSDMAPYSICTLIDNVVDMSNERIAHKKITLSVFVAPDIPISAIGDDGRIRQVLLNIITNAIRYTDDGIVSIRVSGTYLMDGRFEYEYCITDTGRNAFAPDMDFEQAFASGNELGVEFSTGYGISLMVAKKIANALDGDISFRSIKGRGSIFVFRFPSQLLERKTLMNQNYNKRLTITFLGDSKSGFDDFKIICRNYDIQMEEAQIISQLHKPADDDTRYQVLIFDYEKFGKRIATSEKAKSYVKIAVLSERKVPTKLERDFIFVRSPLSALTLQKILLEHEERRNNVDSGNFFTAPTARILVVDDNSLNLDIARSMLENFEVFVDTVDSGYECIKLLERGNNYDLIFMDYMMEGMDGIEATRIIRNMKGKIGRVPILAFTANEVEGAREKYLAAGMNDAVFKPANRLAFAKALKQYLPPELLVAGKIESESSEEKQVSEYPDIPGIDKELAIKYSGGNVTVYKDMLATFAIEIDSRESMVREYFEEANYKDFVIQVHGIKGLARTLGIQELAARMARLEKAGENSDREYIAANINSIMTAYREYKDILEPFVREKKSHARKATSTDGVEAVLVKMHDALEEFEMEEAETLFEKLWPGEYDKQRMALMRNLKESIDRVDYYASKDYVDKLIDTYEQKA